MATPNQVSIVFNYKSLGEAAAAGDLKKLGDIAQQAADKATKAIDKEIAAVERLGATSTAESTARNSAAASAAVFLQREKAAVEQLAFSRVNAAANRIRLEVEQASSVALLRAENATAAREEIAQAAARARRPSGRLRRSPKSPRSAAR